MTANHGDRIGVVGATGLVGQELVSILRERGVHADRISLYGRTASHDRAWGLDIQPLESASLRYCAVAFLAVPTSVARELAPTLANAGVTTIDNSSAFRMSASVPLVVPEVNGSAAIGPLIANPNCSTILLVLAVAPLHRALGCRHVSVCTYQAVSGAGRDALDRLRRESAAYLAGAPAVTDGSAVTRNRDKTNRDSALDDADDMAFNVWSHESPVDEVTGMNEEESKIVNETHKILGEQLPVSATCIRVPVERAHGEAVTVEFNEPQTEADVRSVLLSAPGVRVIDDRRTGRAPTTRHATLRDEVFVGRIRPDHTSLTGGGAALRFHLWLTGDQLRKGAALNAVQIAELVGLV